MAMLKRSELDTAVWGCGYGSRKHLVDRENSRLRVPDQLGYHDVIVSQCKPTQYLTFVDTADPYNQVPKKKVCVRCQEILDAQRKLLEAATS